MINTSYRWFLVSDGLLLDYSRDICIEWFKHINPFVFVAFIHPKNAETLLIKELLPLLTSAERAETNSFYFLVPRVPAPEVTMRNDGEVLSYACTIPVYRALCTHHQETRSFSAFEAGQAIMGSTLPDLQLECFQLPATPSPQFSSPLPACEWLIPHRGCLYQLESSLCSVAYGSEVDDQVSVCFDENITKQHYDLAERFRDSLNFFLARPQGIGPYAVRNWLAQLSKFEYLIFQDSDDMACTRRRRSLMMEMIRTECDWIGSHELRVDEVNAQVVAYRFPLDVNAALDVRPSHSLLFASSLIRRSALWNADGFSTNLQFGSDTQLLLRAYFCGLRIRNVDEFLYVRKSHRTSLTNDDATGLHSPVRLALASAWKHAYHAVKSGEQVLHASALSKSDRPDYWDLQIELLDCGDTRAIP